LIERGRAIQRDARRQQAEHRQRQQGLRTQRADGDAHERGIAPAVARHDASAPKQQDQRCREQPHPDDTELGEERADLVVRLSMVGPFAERVHRHHGAVFGEAP
jgi:hypothetical protein